MGDVLNWTKAQRDVEPADIRSNNDALSRRDMGLEFLDVTGQVNIALVDSSSLGPRQQDRYTFTNNSASILDTHLLIVVHGLSAGTRMVNASGVTSTGDPYLRVFVPDGVLDPGQSIVATLWLRAASARPAGELHAHGPLRTGQPMRWRGEVRPRRGDG